MCSVLPSAVRDGHGVRTGQATPALEHVVFGIL